MLNIAIPYDEIETFCQKNHIRKLALFGSVLSDKFASVSDIDVLVEFEVGHTPGWEFITMQDELSEILGREVDLNTVGFLSPHFQNDVLQEMVVVYERAR